MGNPRQKRVAIAIVLSTLGATAFFVAQGSTNLLAASLQANHSLTTLELMAAEPTTSTHESQARNGKWAGAKMATEVLTNS